MFELSSSKRVDDLNSNVYSAILRRGLCNSHKWLYSEDTCHDPDLNLSQISDLSQIWRYLVDPHMVTAPRLKKDDYDVAHGVRNNWKPGREPNT